MTVYGIALFDLVFFVARDRGLPPRLRAGDRSAACWASPRSWSRSSSRPTFASPLGDVARRGSGRSSRRVRDDAPLRRDVHRLRRHVHDHHPGLLPPGARRRRTPSGSTRCSAGSWASSRPCSSWGSRSSSSARTSGSPRRRTTPTSSSPAQRVGGDLAVGGRQVLHRHAHPHLPRAQRAAHPRIAPAALRDAEPAPHARRPTIRPFPRHVLEGSPVDAAARACSAPSSSGPPTRHAGRTHRRGRGVRRTRTTRRRTPDRAGRVATARCTGRRGTHTSIVSTGCTAASTSSPARRACPPPSSCARSSRSRRSTRCRAARVAAAAARPAARRSGTRRARTSCGSVDCRRRSLASGPALVAAAFSVTRRRRRRRPLCADASALCLGWTSPTSAAPRTARTSSARPSCAGPRVGIGYAASPWDAHRVAILARGERGGLAPCGTPTADRLMDAKSVALLEFPAIRARLAAATQFPPEPAARGGARAVVGPGPRRRAAWTRRTRRARSSRSGPGVGIGGAHDIGPAVERAARGGRLEAAQFVAIAETLDGGRRGSPTRSVASADRSCATSDARSRRCRRSAASSSAASTRRASCSTRRRRDSGGLRRAVRIAYDRLRARLETLVHSSELGGALQEPIITLRNGRYVVPVRADARVQGQGDRPRRVREWPDGLRRADDRRRARQRVAGGAARRAGGDRPDPRRALGARRHPCAGAPRDPRGSRALRPVEREGASRGRDGRDARGHVAGRADRPEERAPPRAVRPRRSDRRGARRRVHRPRRHRARTRAARR